MPQRNLFILLATIALSLVCYARSEQNPYARYVTNAYREISQRALDDVPDQLLFDGALRGMVDVLHDRGDEHSLFIPAKDAELFLSEVTQEFGGIGVRIQFHGEPPRLTVLGPPEPGTPAFKAGIRSGDVILAIDGRSTEGWNIVEVLQNMRGDAGQPIRLSVLRPGEVAPIAVVLIRETIPIPSILGDRRSPDGQWLFQLPDDPRIIYIRITIFGNKTVTELTDTLHQLSQNGGRALILDLRDNAGGALPAAITIAEMFLPAGVTIVETRGRDEVVLERFISSGGEYAELPIAVLVNRYSASASEIVAAALQDHHRAVIIGERSFGKGTVQRLVEVESGRSRLKLTSASFWRPGGENIHRMPGVGEEHAWGVRPDAGFEVPLTDDQYAAYREFRSHKDQADTFEAAASEDNGQNAEFVDEALRQAAEHLQAQLGE